MAEQALISLRGVTKIYGTGEAEVVALAGIDLDIRDGEFVAVMGPSGSGKSTTMNILGCLDTPTGGHYYFRGADVGAMSKDQLALLRRHYLGFVFQGFNLLKRTTALETLASVGLADRADHTAAELSGGQQQRVAIARALVTNPSVMFADEPTGNLDSAKTHEIMQLLKSLNEQRGLTIVLVTHEEDVAAYAKRQVRFRDGHIESDTGPKP